MLVEFDPDLLEPQPLGVRHAAGRHQHCVGGDRLAIVEVDEQRAVLLFLDRLKRRVEAEFDALGHRNLQQPVADLLVIAAQYRVAAVNDRHLAADSVERSEEHTSELQSLMRISYAAFCLKQKSSE